jgi:hypothetical protein
MALSKHRQLPPSWRCCSDPDQVHEDHDPLLLEDMEVEEPSSPAENDRLVVTAADEDEGDARCGRIDSKEATTPST